MLTTDRVPFRLAAAGLAALATLAPALAGGKVAVKAGRVLTSAGEEIEDGVVVIENGRVTAVGPAADVEIPWDADVLEHPDLVAFPGWVEAHDNDGMDRANESIDVTPFLDVRDSIDPVAFYFEEALREGVLTINVQQGNDCVIGGQGMVVRPFGMTVEEMLVSPASGLKMSAAPKRGKSRATQLQSLRGAFTELRQHLEELVQETRDGGDKARREALYQGRDLEGEKAKGRAMGGSAWKVEGLETVPRGVVDEKLEPLLDVVEGRVPVWFYCAQPMDVEAAIAVARENGFLERTKLVLEAPCWKAAEAIAAADVPVVLGTDLVHIERDPVSGEEIETFVPRVMRDAGVRFALQSDSDKPLWYQAATCLGYGFERAEVLAAATAVPAEMLGLADRVGQLAPGFDGNLVLCSGDPLSVTSHVEYVILRGELVYDRSKDVRNKHLLEGVVPENTQADGEVEGAAHVHGDDDIHSDETGDDEEGEGE